MTTWIGASCAAGLVVIAGCKEATAPSVSTVSISPRVAAVAVGDSVALTATLHDAAGHLISGVAILWSSSDTTVASVSSGGLVRARQPGSTTISAAAAAHGDTLDITVSVQYVSVSDGLDHACALGTNGAAYCWGHGHLGDLGNGTTTDQTTPTLVAGGHTFRSLATMTEATCALATDSTAWCWGWGGEGQLGAGDTLSRLTPVAVAGGQHFGSLVGGESHACGLAASGTAYCWGWNASGQVSPNLGNVLAPAPISGGLTLGQVSAGTNQSCGLTTGGAAYCWGGNFGLELGAVTDSANYLPAPIAGGGSYLAVTGGSPTCALAAGSTVSCWSNGVGAVDYRRPSPLPGGLSFSQIGGASKGTTACGVTAAGDAYCWGWPQYSWYAFDPSLVPGGHHFSQAWGGDLAHCGLATDSTAWCWGFNDYGGLGDSLAEDSSVTPVPVRGGHKFLSVQASDGVVCGLGVDSAAYCWGQSVATTPRQVPGGVTFKSVTAGGWEWMCGLRTDGAAYCWGGTLLPYSATAVPGGLTFVSVSAGDGHACGVDAGGSAHCWGWNLMGDLGVPGVRSYSATPVAVSGPTTFASVSPLFMSTCGVATNGTVLCWGSNEGAALGNGTDAVESRVPLPVLGGHTFVSLTAGPYHTCALVPGGAAWCWGSGYSDTTAADIGGRTPSVTPIQVPGGQSFSSLTLDYDLTCGLTSAGAAYCWGEGNPNPTAVQDSLRFISVSASAAGVCGVTTAHRLTCWNQGTVPAVRRRAGGRRPPSLWRASLR